MNILDLQVANVCRKTTSVHFLKNKRVKITFLLKDLLQVLQLKGLASVCPWKIEEMIGGCKMYEYHNL